MGDSDSEGSSLLIPHRQPRNGVYLGLLLAGYVCNFTDRTLVSVLLEPIKEEFDLTDLELGLFGGAAFGVFYTTMAVVMARLADRYSRVNILTACVAVWSGMTALQGLAADFAQLFLFRVLVGVGESGAEPASHALIANLYPDKQRARAMGIYSAGIPIGAMLGTSGGLIAGAYGWRITFVVCGLPGVLLAVLMRLLLREPKRNSPPAPFLPEASPDSSASSFPTASQPQPPSPAPPPPSPSSFWAAVRGLLGRRTFRLQALGGGFMSFFAYGNGTFGASFWARKHQLALDERTYLLMAGLTLNIVSALAGGFLCEKWAKIRGDKRPYAWLPAMAAVAHLPFSLPSYFVESLPAAIALGLLPSLFANMWHGPCFALAQTLAPPQLRALASSVLLFVINCIGLGLGPLAVGGVSHALQEQAGMNEAKALSWALAFGAAGCPVAAVCFWRSGSTVDADAREVASQGQATGGAPLRSEKQPEGIEL